MSQVPHGATTVRTACLVALMLAILFAASPARADVLREMKDKHLALRELADCTVRPRPKVVEKALTADPRTSGFDDWLDRSGDGECHIRVMQNLGFSIWPHENLFRYALAEAVFRFELSTAHLTDLQRVAPLAHGLSPRRSSYDREIPAAPTPEQVKAEDAAYIYLAEMAECAIRADPDGAFNLLSAEFMSNAENRAFESIAPSLGACTDAAQKLTIDRESIRGALALEYLRLARAPRQPIPVAGAVK